VGYSENPQERVIKHSQKHKGFTGKAADWKILYKEKYPDKRTDMKRETEIKKKKSRKYIEFLINNESDE
jgi:putative endonuclease